MKIYFKHVEQFMEDNVMNQSDVARLAGVDKSVITRMRKRGTADVDTVRAINRALKREIHRKPGIVARSVA